MSDTKALDSFLHHVRPGFLCACLSIEDGAKCNCGRDQAAAELEELKHKWHWVCVCNYENTFPVCTHCGKTYAGNLAQLRAELDEARKTMRYIRLRPSEAIEIAGAFLSAHPEETK